MISYKHFPVSKIRRKCVYSPYASEVIRKTEFCKSPIITNSRINIQLSRVMLYNI